jgi:hypothetical protein
MSDIPTLDRIDWHASSPAFPEGVSRKNAGTHIGMFLAWCVLRNMLAPELREPLATPIQALRERRMTGKDFLAKHCDGKLVVELLTREAGSFAGAYYPSKYIKDYKRILAAGLPTEYHVVDTWANYERLEPVVSEAFQKWKNPPWWKIF